MLVILQIVAQHHGILESRNVKKLMEILSMFIVSDGHHPVRWSIVLVGIKASMSHVEVLNDVFAKLLLRICCHFQALLTFHWMQIITHLQLVTFTIVLKSIRLKIYGLISYGKI